MLTEDCGIVSVAWVTMSRLSEDLKGAEDIANHLRQRSGVLQGEAMHQFWTRPDVLCATRRKPGWVAVNMRLGEIRSANTYHVATSDLGDVVIHELGLENPL